ncbi:MAG: PAS domain S-box protein [Bacteroidota bacterium]|jgi:PAS domain S-box-containing protein|nr:PAS domain S-box protein [Sphingobacteriales bacterium]
MNQQEPYIDEISLRAIFNDAIDAMIIINERGFIEQLNPSVIRLFGYNKEEMLGKNIAMLMPEPYHGQHDKFLNNYHQTGEKKVIGIGREVSGKRKDGSIFPIFLSVSEVFLPEGRKVFAGVMRDVSDLTDAREKANQYTQQLERVVEERTQEIRGVVRALELTNQSLENQYKETKRAEQELLTNQLLFSSIAKNYPNGAICIFNRDMVCEFVEGKELERIGLTREDFLGKKITESFAGHENASIHEYYFKRTIAGEEISYEIGFAGQSYLMNTTPILEDSGEINRMVALVHNVSAMKEAEERMKHALDQANQLNEMKSRFISLASHEFRTPLSTILSSLNLLLRYHESQQTEKVKLHAKKIKASIANLTEILEYFLSVEKLESGEVKMEYGLMDIENFTLDFVAVMRDIIDDNLHIQFTSNLIHKEMMMDKKAYRTIIQNLISNAIKYSPKGGHINIELQTNQQQLLIIISDEGLGIPEEDQRHLFERFYRATNASNIQGTGLGLNIIKKYVELLGGQISFKSTLGKGTSFHISIPIKS